MGLVSLSELRTGMVLEEPVYNDKGIMILPRGTRLTDKHLAQCKRWGVRQADVEGAGREGPANDAAVQLDPELMAAIDRALNEKFALGGDDEIMREVKRIVRDMTAQEALRRKEKRP